MYVVLLSRQGQGKSHLKDFEVSRNNKAFNAISLKGDDQLVGAKLSNGFGDILIILLILGFA